MSQWVPFTYALALANLPTDIRPIYDAWLVANPSRSTRLGEIVAQTVTKFRNAVEGQRNAVLDPDLTMIPASGIDFAQNLVVYTLGMEMGVEFAPGVTTVYIQTNVWLRGVASGTINAVTPTLPEVAEEGTPSYAAPVPRPVRSMD